MVEFFNPNKFKNKKYNILFCFNQAGTAAIQNPRNRLLAVYLAPEVSGNVSQPAQSGVPDKSSAIKELVVKWVLLNLTWSFGSPYLSLVVEPDVKMSCTAVLTV